MVFSVISKNAREKRSIEVTTLYHLEWSRGKMKDFVGANIDSQSVWKILQSGRARFHGSPHLAVPVETKEKRIG